jgi:DNA repair exonuclease SbcCD nuclease subunit
MSRILLFSDIHVAAHKNSLQRLQDCLDTLRWAFQTARERRIADVLFLGDLFHDRQKIQVIAYHNTYQIFREYPDLNIHLLLGNHDLWFYDKWDISSVIPLSALSNVDVIVKPCTKTIAGLPIDFIPFTHDPVAVVRENFKTKSPVLCGHLAIDDSTLNALYSTKAEVSIESEKDVIKVSKDVFAGWKRVFLGHYHCPQRLDQHIEYIGSPLQLSFNEAFQQKHLGILDTGTLECEYVNNTFSPKHLIIRQDEVDKTCLDNNFVQVQVEDVDSSEIIDIRKNILESSTVQSLEFKDIKVRNIKESHDELQTKFDIANGDVLERYIATVGVGSLEHSKLLTIGKDICCED